MKWTEPELGTTRLRRKFLFFPKKLGKTTRWLEVAQWPQMYTKPYGTSKSLWVDDGQWAEDAMINKLQGNEP